MLSRRRFGLLGAAVILGGLAGACDIMPVRQPRNGPPPSPPPRTNGVTDLERQVFEGVNRQRVEQGLKPLAWNDEVARVARAHAERMAELGFFSHDDPEHGGPAERLRAAGIRYRRMAENIFTERGHRNPAATAVSGWMASPDHRRNILDPNLTEAGVGIGARADGTNLFVQKFIRP